MSSNVSGLQQHMIDILKSAMDADPGAQGAPKQVKAYEGELGRIEQVRTLPAVLVDVATQFDIEAQGVAGSIYHGDYQPEIILFAENRAAGGHTVSDLAKLADWVITALRNTVLMIDGIPVELHRRIRGRMITDIKPASCILTCIIQTSEDG